MEVIRDRNDEAKLFLTSIESIGYRTIDKLLKEYESYENIFNLKKSLIYETKLMTENQKEDFLNARNNWNQDRYLAYMDKHQIKLITRDDVEYPTKLLNIPDPPFQLFYCGSLPSVLKPSVSIIGARNCTEYGKHCAKYFAEELAKNGVQIISGLASGIDSIAQKAAVDTGGLSFGVIGSGADICYPKSNWKLFEELKTKGGIISEFPPMTPALAMHFPMRNRIISGLSDIVLVIEARQKSGTAITVNMALEQGREVFAVPGRISDKTSDGCNQLIADGAGVANSLDNILEALGIYSLNNSCVDIKKQIESRDDISELCKKVWFMKLDGITCADEIYKKLIIDMCDVTISDVQMAIVEMNMVEPH